MIEMVQHGDFSFARVPLETLPFYKKGQLIQIYGVLYEIINSQYSGDSCYLTLKERMSKVQKLKRWLKLG